MGGISGIAEPGRRREKLKERDRLWGGGEEDEGVVGRGEDEGVVGRDGVGMGEEAVEWEARGRRDDDKPGRNGAGLGVAGENALDVWVVGIVSSEVERAWGVLCVARCFRVVDGEAVWARLRWRGKVGGGEIREGLGMVEERERERGYPPPPELDSGGPWGGREWENDPCEPSDVFAELCSTSNEPLQLGLPGLAFKIPLSADVESGVRGLELDVYRDWYESCEPELLALNFLGAEPGLVLADVLAELEKPGV